MHAPDCRRRLNSRAATRATSGGGRCRARRAMTASRSSASSPSSSSAAPGATKTGWGRASAWYWGAEPPRAAAARSCLTAGGQGQEDKAFNGDRTMTERVSWGRRAGTRWSKPCKLPAQATRPPPHPPSPGASAPGGPLRPSSRPAAALRPRPDPTPRCPGLGSPLLSPALPAPGAGFPWSASSALRAMARAREMRARGSTARSTASRSCMGDGGGAGGARRITQHELRVAIDAQACLEDIQHPATPARPRR